MTLAIIGSHPNDIVKFDEENLIIINKGSWDIYWKLSNEDLRVEYIEEKIYIQTPANLDHERIFIFLVTKINEFLAKNTIGELLGSRFPIELEDGKRVEPDILFLKKSEIRKDKLSKTAFKGEPTWIIEIVSPSYREHDTVTKRKVYQNLNVNEYWIIDPENKTIETMNFETKIEKNPQIFKEGKISPRIEGFNDFSIKVDEIWDLISK